MNDPIEEENQQDELNTNDKLAFKMHEYSLKQGKTIIDGFIDDLGSTIGQSVEKIENLLQEYKELKYKMSNTKIEIVLSMQHTKNQKETLLQCVDELRRVFNLITYY